VTKSEKNPLTSILSGALPIDLSWSLLQLSVDQFSILMILLPLLTLSANPSSLSDCSSLSEEEHFTGSCFLRLRGPD